VAATAASCSSSDDEGTNGPGPLDTSDAAPETSRPGDEADAEADAPPLRDAAPFDAAPLPVVCASAPCATSLVTTIADEYPARSEGYCALLDDGAVACWGTNAQSQLGRGDDAAMGSSSTPARVVGVSNVTHLDHTCAVNASGEIWCWGKGPYLRSAAANTTERTAVLLPLPPAKKVAMSVSTACALVDAGVTCWGSNASGIVAPYGAASLDSVLEPRAVALPAGAPVRDIVIGDAAFALREDGTTASWGANPPLGRVSSLFPDPYPTPTALAGITAIDVVADSACAVAGGTGHCWGASIDASPALRRLDRAFPEPVVAPEPLVQIATTRSYITYGLGDPLIEPYRWCAVSAAGSVYCWGLNASGQAGDGTKQHAYDAVKVTDLPAPAAQVKTMPLSTCALLTTGKVYCWGNNFHGQLGNGQLKGESLVPQEVVLP